ncbi:hypothetical protein ACFXTH_011617 [Malus domestica]
MAPKEQCGVKKRKLKRKSLEKMADSLSLVVIPNESAELAATAAAASAAIKGQWEVHFSRFFPYPPQISTCPDLVPLPPKFRKRRPRNNWIPSSSPAQLQLARDGSSSDAILTVCFTGKILEEHYVSKIQFIWPQVSCMSGFPARGTRAVFVNYKDPAGKASCSILIQKFGLRFLSLSEAEKFMNALKEICKEGKDNEAVNTDCGPEMSSQSGLVSSNRPHSRACKDSTTMTSVETCTPHISPSVLDKEADQTVQTYMPQISPSLLKNEADQAVQSYKPQISPCLLKSEAGQSSHAQQSVHIDNFQSNFAALPPSFTSFLSNCGPVIEQVMATQPTAPQEEVLKSQIAKYMEDASFQDMLFKVEKVISEIGGDMLL